MKAKITHTTNYKYSKPVFLEKHVIRLRPPENLFQMVKNYEININKTPVCLTPFYDIENNLCYAAWFENLHEEMIVTISFESETLNSNPFNFILDLNSVKIPFEYELESDNLIKPYLGKDNNYGNDFESYIKKILDSVDNSTLGFLSALNNKIFTDFKYMERETGHPLSVQELMETKEGSCRDFTNLFIQGCRSIGLASRFVSGYTVLDESQKVIQLHAWAEVYLPGAGWVGYDPSHNVAVSDKHIFICASANHNNTLPIIGSFRANGGESQLEYTVILDEIYH